MRFRKVLLIALTILVTCASVVSAETEPIHRGMALGEIMRALDLPLKTGKTFDDVDNLTPYHAEMESALSLGIIYPTDEFSPEIPCANAEALMFALQAMGFRHEAEIAVWALPNPDKKLPTHIEGYVALAKTLKPAPPKRVCEKPWGSLSLEDLEDIVNWLHMCRESVVWDYDVKRPEGTLHLHRENVGRPPEGWRVQLGIFESEENARRMAAKYNTDACPVLVIERDYNYAVATPKFSDRIRAYKAAQRLGKHAAVIRPEAGTSSALFWVSFMPSNTADAVIRMNHAISPKALGKLSKMAEANNAIVAMNGGYFYSAGAIGTVFAYGMPASLPYHNRSMVAWSKNGEIYFGGGEFRTRLSVNGGAPFTISINKNADFGDTAVLTPAFGLSSNRAGNNGLVARVHDGMVVEAVKALTFKRDMRPDEWLIVTRDPDLTLEVGDRVALVTQWREDVPFEPQAAVQAGPLIYAPGRTMVSESLSPGILMMRHPRTLVGSDGKKLTWIVVDGRSAWHSRGLTLAEAAALGRRLKLKYLLNLDGGGSSEMWWDGHVVNEVSDGRERSMPYGLMVLRHDD